MPPPSKLDRFFSSTEQLKLAQFLRENPTVSVDDFRAHLAAQGLDVGRSTAHEYQQKLGALGERLRQQRMLMDTLKTNLDEAGVEGERGRVLVEMARVLLFEFQQKIIESGVNKLEAKDFAFLGKALEGFAKAARYGQDFETKVAELRATIAAEERAKAADAAVSAAIQAGMSRETIADMKASILSVDLKKPTP